MVKTVYFTRCVRRLAALSLATLTLQGGCVSPRVDVSSNSIADVARPVDRTATVEIFHPEAAADLQHAEALRWVKEKLSAAGVPLSEGGSCRYVLTFVYAIDEGRDVPYSYSVPVYGQVGGGTATFSGTYNQGTAGWGTFSGSSYTAPQYGVVGTSHHSGVNRFFAKSFVAVLFVRSELAVNSKAMPVWQTNSVSVGTDADMRSILPILINASLNLYGTDSGKRIEKRYVLDPSAPLPWAQSKKEAVAPVHADATP